jgi:hypothetical protein
MASYPLKGAVAGGWVWLVLLGRGSIQDVARPYLVRAHSQLITETNRMHLVLFGM